MAISNKLVELNNVKQGIKQAIVDKGVDMTDVPFTSYPTKIGEISSGGGSIITTPDYYMEQFENGVAVTVTKTGALPANFMRLYNSVDFKFLKLTIPNSVTSIGDSAFDGWTANNQPLVISNSVTSIGSMAFYYWVSNNQPLVIPYSVTSIGSMAFNAWSLVPYVEIKATTPPTLSNSNAFSFQNNAPIYVPDASVDDYKTATNWSALASRIFPISSKP